MYIYAVLLAIGFFGIVGMASAGFLHMGHGNAHSHGHGGHGHATHGSHGLPIRGAPSHAGVRHGGLGRAAKSSLRSFLSISPLDLFSYCVGAGVAGLLLRPYMQKEHLPFAAIAGALIFDICFTRLIANTIQRFSADPSSGLEGSIAQAGEAATNFDARGQGLIKLTLDGQIIQLLANLEEHELAAGVTVRKGDPLVVVQVDATKNQCLVTRELAQAPIDFPMKS